MMHSAQNIISKIIEDIKLPDGSSLKLRCSDFVFKDNSFGCAIDIHGMKLEEAKKIQKSLTAQIKGEFPELSVNIVLTENKAGDKASKPKMLVENVENILLVASGKGGVGKSTITALLAHSLQKAGKKVGIIDADIYGPSIPNIFGLKGKPELINNRMVPFLKDGIAINSIGFLTKPEAAISWRGPMASKAIYQLMSLTAWPDLDYLLIDSPPGTGDIHLSLLQNYPIDQAYIVTTPQAVSRLDVEKAIDLYKKFNVKIGAIIENMSYLEGKDDEKIIIFPGNAAQELAEKYKVHKMVQIPLKTEISAICDQGTSLKKYASLLQELF